MFAFCNKMTNFAPRNRSLWKARCCLLHPPAVFAFHTECLVNLFKNKNHANKKQTSERAVHAFQHTLLRLPHCSKRARNKATFIRSHQHYRRTDSVSNLLHHQRLRVRSVGLRQGATPYLARLRYELPLCCVRCAVRCPSCRPVLG